MPIGDRRSDFKFKEDQMQYNHDFRVWICGAEVTVHLRGSITLRRGDKSSPSTLNFDLDNVKDIFTITAANKGYIENPDGTFSKNENPKTTPIDDSLSDEIKKKINKIYEEVEQYDSDLQALELNHEQALKAIDDKYNKELKNAEAKENLYAQKGDRTQMETWSKVMFTDIPNNKNKDIQKETDEYERKKTALEKKKQVAQSRLDKMNMKIDRDASGNYTYSAIGDFGRNNETSQTTGKATKTKKKTKKIKSEEVIFNSDENLYNEDNYSDAAKKLIYTNKTILNANINFGNFLKENGLGFNPYDLNIDTPIIEKHDPIRIFIKDPSRPFLTNTLETTEDKYWIPLFTGFIDSVTEHNDYITGDKFLSVSCYDIRGIMQRMRVMTNPRISRGTDNARERAEAAKKLSVNTGYFTDFFAQSGLGGEKSTKYLHYKFDQVCLEFLTGRWNKYDNFADKYVGKLVSTQSNEILEDTEYLKKINEAVTRGGKKTEPSLNGVGTFLPGAIIECPRYDKEPDKCQQIMELWYDILMFGIKATYFTKDEMEYVGNNTLPYGLFDPYNCFVHMITPPGGTEAKNLFDSQLEDLQTGFEYQNRFEFFTQLVERLDYQWFTNSMGDIVIEFPMYDFEPSIFGAYKGQLTVNNHLTACTINETANTIFSAVSASGGISSITGAVQGSVQYIYSAFAKSDQLAYKYGINIEEYTAPNLKTNTETDRLLKQAIIELIKSNMSVSSMEVEMCCRFALFPNKPLYCVPKHRMATISGFSYTIQINESVSCTADTIMVKKLNQDNKFINIYNSTNTPIKYLGGNDIELSDASLAGIDVFYIDGDNKPVKELRKNSK